jgi:hypothetical protein
MHRNKYTTNPSFFTETETKKSEARRTVLKMYTFHYGNNSASTKGRLYLWSPKNRFQFDIHNIHARTLCREFVSVLIMDFRAKKDHSLLQHCMIDFYNEGAVCLLRDKNWIFKLTEVNWPWLRRLEASLSRRKPRFHSGIVVIFLVDKVALQKVLHRVLRFSSVNVIQPLPQNHHLQADLISRKIQQCFSANLKHYKEKYFHLLILKRLRKCVRPKSTCNFGKASPI